jgi:hypothetical protein
MPSRTETLLSYVLQLFLLKHWTAPSTDQHAGSSLFLSLIHTTSSPRDFWRFFAVLYNISIALTTFMLQTPAADEVHEYCLELQTHLIAHSLGVPADRNCLRQLAELIRDTIERTCAKAPEFAAQRAELLPLDSPEKVDKAVNISRQLATYLLYAMIDCDQHHDTFHKIWNFWQCITFPRAFGHEYRHHALIDYDEPQVRRV